MALYREMYKNCHRHCEIHCPWTVTGKVLLTQPGGSVVNTRASHHCSLGLIPSISRWNDLCSPSCTCVFPLGTKEFATVGWQKQTDLCQYDRSLAICNNLLLMSKIHILITLIKYFTSKTLRSPEVSEFFEHWQLVSRRSARTPVVQVHVSERNS